MNRLVCEQICIANSSGVFFLDDKVQQDSQRNRVSGDATVNNGKVKHDTERYAVPNSTRSL